MKGRRGFTLIELLVVIAIIAVLAAILFPVFAKARKAAQQSNCQSNMKQVGNSIKMYLSDWEETYPTNKKYTNMNVLLPEIQLSIYGSNPTDGKPYRFQYGITWVEALYSYMEPATKVSDSQSVWKCQAASNATFPIGLPTDFCTVSYAMNFNLLEMPEGAVRMASSLMLVREMDRQVTSVARGGTTGTNPTQVSSQSQIPNRPFLTATDPYMTGIKCNFKMHGTGSNILFADGHVKQYDAAGFFPETITAANCWDADTQAWYNVRNVAGNKRSRSIMISP
jgi:prepilin-type N-terminal cleavage/methylation domain-containing protein/prepilin-type processing-associated H-X9-DG protein